MYSVSSIPCSMFLDEIAARFKFNVNRNSFGIIHSTT